MAAGTLTVPAALPHARTHRPGTALSDLLLSRFSNAGLEPTTPLLPPPNIQQQQEPQAKQSD